MAIGGSASFKNARRRPHYGNSFLACLSSCCLHFPWPVSGGEWVVGHGSDLSWPTSHPQWPFPLELLHEVAGSFYVRSRLCLRVITSDMASGTYEGAFRLSFSTD